MTLRAIDAVSCVDILECDGTVVLLFRSHPNPSPILGSVKVLAPKKLNPLSRICTVSQVA